MAESSSSSSSSSSPSTSSTSTTPTSASSSKQYIRASVDDTALEPDALRGSEQVMKDAGVHDDEQDRRDAQAQASKTS